MRYETFENLHEDRKKRILEACTEEFSKNGYANASTNEIVRKAGISKGILFHYFGNKKDLYLYILDHSVDYLLEKYYSEAAELPTDFIDRILRSGLIKLRIAHEEPMLYGLLFNTFFITPDELKEEIQIRYERIYDREIPAFLEGIDVSAFREGIDKNKAIETVILVLQGLQNKYAAQYISLPKEQSDEFLDKVVQESLEYVEILKKGIYK